MAKQKMRLRFPNIILLLCGLILIIFLFDFLWRNIISPTVPGDTKDIVTADGTFAASDSTENEDEVSTDIEENENATDDEDESENNNEDPFSEVITMSQGQIHNGPLVLVSSTCPFLGTTNLTDFTANVNSNVKPRDTSLKIAMEMEKPLSDLFDAYCMDNGYVNLQIYSTIETNTAAGSLYTTDLIERGTGYTFDIALITSTGDLAPYISKRNEWMFGNCWKYGFIVRYSDTKTGTTGVGFMPHHFRYVGLPHSLIMNEKDMCLEEYLQMLTEHKMDSPLTYSTDTKDYKIFYVKAESSGDTNITIPKGAIYSVSGNNTDGFIVTIESNRESSQTAMTDAPEDTSSESTSSETVIAESDETYQ